MFDISLFSNPRGLKDAFLATTEVATQTMGPELRLDFERIREKDPDLQMTANFWVDFIRTYPRHLALIAAGRGLGVLLTLGAVLSSQRILDDANTLVTALVMLLLYACTQFVSRILNAYLALLQNQLLVCVRTFVTLRMNWKLLRMGNLSSQEFSTGNLKTLISSDIYRIADFLGNLCRNGIPCLLGLVILGPVIWVYMGIPGLVALLVAFASLPLAYFFGKYIFHKEEAVKQQEDTLATIVGEWVTQVRLLRYLGWERMLAAKVAGHVRKLVIEMTKQHSVNLINFGISVSWWLMPIIAMIYSARMLGDSADLTTLFASIWMLNSITMFIRWLPGIFVSYGAAAACILRLNRLFSHADIENDLLPPCGANVTGATPCLVQLDHVSFRYQEDMVLEDVNLVLDMTRFTSVIGTVGSGKSTLLQLICGEMKPSSGRILIGFDNGITANLWHRDIYKAFRSSVGYMSQEAYLSNTSFAINVSLDEFHADQDVMRAVQLAELEADIALWENGIAEEVGETGVNLSGGQKQRVNLARALYSRRPYLLLDDPLSAVDASTESALMQALLQQCNGFLLSSHRLMELHRCDRLLVLHQGRIIEDGVPDDLARDHASEFNRYLRAAEIEHAA